MTSPGTTGARCCGARFAFRNARSRACLHREREPGRPQLRVVVSPDEEICDALVEECDDRVYVRVVMCYDERKACTDDSFVNCPVHVYLKQPLGEISDATGRGLGAVKSQPAIDQEPRN
jgi:hypothetical protein